MKKTLVALLLCALTLCFCGAAQAEITVTDMTGRTITLDAPAERIVALTAADCEILCALGAEDVLVGRGAYCDYPESVLALPAVESGAETNIEQIIALAPQVVLMGTMAQTVEQVQALEQAGIAVVVSDAQNIAGVYEAINLIGALMGREAEAEAMVQQMQQTFDAIAAQAQPTGRTVYFEVSPLQWGLWTAGSDTFMDELAAICGLTNAFADVSGWAAISEEQVLARDPDYIVTTATSYGDEPEPAAEICAREGWQGLKAVQQGQVFTVDSNAFSRPGPRLMDAAQALFDAVTEAEAAVDPAA